MTPVHEFDTETIEQVRAAKDSAYEERNRCVVALAHMARLAGCHVGRAVHQGEWEEDWRNILYIDLPTGQASWHFHDSQAYLLQGFGSYLPQWDGHSTEEKYERLERLARL